MEPSTEIFDHSHRQRKGCLRDNETGVDVLSRIDEMFQTKIPAIVMTGDIDPNCLKELQSNQITTLHKPCDPHILFNYLADINLDDASLNESKPVKKPSHTASTLTTSPT